MNLAVLNVFVKAQGINTVLARMQALQVQGMSTARALTRVETAAAGAGAAGKKAGKDANKGAQGMQNLSKFARGAGLAMGAFAGYSIKAASQFETTMNQLQVISGATARQMKSLNAQAIRLGADLRLPMVSAQDASEAMIELSKAGLSVKQIQGGIRSTLLLSAAAHITNAKAAEISSNAMNTFKLRGEDTSYVVDQFANVANKSSVSIEQAAASFQMAGAVFSGFQRPVLGSKGAITELNAAIGILGNAGIKGSDAGTSLKQMLLQLTGPAKVSKDAMRALYLASVDNTLSEEQMTQAVAGTKKERTQAVASLEKQAGMTKKGGDIAYDAAGKMRSLREIIRLVTLGTRNMTQEQRQQYITQIFGADATRAVIALMQANTQGIDKMTSAIETQGTAQKVADARMKGFRGAILGLKSTAETLAITFGIILLPAVTAVARGMTKFLQFLAANQSILVAAAAGIGALATALLVLKAVAVLPAMFAALLSPVGLVVAAIALLTAGFVYAYRESETFRNIVGAVLQWLKTAAGNVADAVTAAFKWIGEIWGNVTQAIVGEVRQWDMLFALVKLVANRILGVWRSMFNAIRALFRVGIVALAPIATAAWGVVTAVFKAAWVLIKAIVTGGLQQLRGVIKIIGGMFKGDFGQIWEGVKNVFSGWMRVIGGVFRAWGTLLRGIVSGIGKGMAAAFNTMWDNLGGIFRGGVNAVIGFLNILIKAINLIPGVPNIDPIAKIGGGGGGSKGKGTPQNSTGGGGTDTQRRARGGAFQKTGGLINSPIVMMGEEAPKHPEYVIPTNPAYRNRAQGLLTEAAGAIGFQKGGVYGGIPGLGLADGGKLSQAAIRQLAQTVGMPNPTLMAAVAMAESGGDTDIIGPPSGRGLWQIEWNVWANTMAQKGLTNPNNPLQNAKMAKHVLREQGINAWVAYRNGNYKQFMPGGVGAVADAAGAAADFLNPMDIIDKFPGIGDLPDLFKGTGKYVLDKAKDWVTDKVNSLFPDFGGGATLPPGMTKGNIGKAATLARSLGGTITSSLRSGSANASLHNVGRALDIGGSPAVMMRVFKGLAAEFGSSINELFYDPVGWYIDNHRRVQGAIGDHGDHVHVAFQKGGLFGGLFGAGGLNPKDDGKNKNDASGAYLQLPSSFTPTHPTSGLAGYRAIDKFAKPGTRVLSPINGKVTKLSESTYTGPGGPFGKSMYLKNDLATYFLTHMGSRAVGVGDFVRYGDMIGTVGNYPNSNSDHIHMGVNGSMGRGSSVDPNKKKTTTQKKAEEKKKKRPTLRYQNAGQGRKPGAPIKGFPAPLDNKLLRKAMDQLRAGGKKSKGVRATLNEQIAQIGLPSALTAELQELADRSNTQAEYANRAGSLTDNQAIQEALDEELKRRFALGQGFPEADQATMVQSMLGRIGGHSQLDWLQAQLTSLFLWRNRIIAAQERAAQIRAHVIELATQARARLAMVKQAMAEAHNHRVDLIKKVWAARDQIDVLKKRPKKNKDKIEKLQDNIKTWKKRIGDIEDENGKRLKLRKALEDDPGGIIARLVAKRKEIDGVRTSLGENLTEVQGVGSPTAIMGILPDVGVLGGRIFDVQMQSQQLAGEHGKLRAVQDANSGQDSGAALKAEILQEMVREGQRREAVLSAQYDIFKNMPDFGGSFATGGVVPGLPGEARTIIAHGGETIIPEGGFPAPNVNITLGPGVKDLIRVEVEKSTRQQARSARTLPGRAGGLS